LEREEPTKEYPKGIAISEVLPSPEGPDSEKEWIEISNQNDFEVDVSGWKVSDSIGSVTTYVFPDNAKIGPGGFLVLYRPETKIILNNEGDGLKLLSPDEVLVDFVDYEKAGLNESYNRFFSSWAWSSFLTPGAENKMADKIKEISGKEEEIHPTTSEKTIASIVGPISGLRDGEGYDLSRIRLIALTISLFSGIVILTLKEKVKQLK
jgi:hypothetical protein